MARITHEAWKVYGNVFDNYTLNLLFKISSQGHFKDLQSPVSIGKEANIFTAKKVDGHIIIVKIYRLESCNFNKMFDYIKSDQRFQNLKRQRRKVIFTWVMREYQNLMKAREAGVRVPMPIAIKDHVLVLEMIGDKTAARKLKDTHLGDPKDTTDMIVEDMKKMFNAGLVHGDLSEYNILVHNGTPFFIDFSQGTTKKDPNFYEYWERDLKNISRYFTKIGIKTTVDDLKRKIGYKEE